MGGIPPALGSLGIGSGWPHVGQVSGGTAIGAVGGGGMAPWGGIMAIGAPEGGNGIMGMGGLLHLCRG